MSHAIHGHLSHIHHHGKKHMYAFRVKHNVSEFTILLLVLLALQINILYLLWMMPTQSLSVDIPMSFVGSTLPAFTEIIGNFLLAI
jgi:hypothetical protein